MLGSHLTPKNHAARARPSYAVLSFAFTFFGTLPVNQSRTPYYTKIDIQVTPIIDTLFLLVSSCLAALLNDHWGSSDPAYLPKKWRSQASVSMVEVRGVEPLSFRLYCCLSTTDILFRYFTFSLIQLSNGRCIPVEPFQSANASS